MTDPLEALHTPALPVEPDPAFARALRNRLERALLVTSPMEHIVTSTLAPATARLHTLTPYLAVVDARAAVAFYVDAFGARRRDEPVVMPDGRVGHVEVALGDSVLMLADEYPEMGLVAPANRGGPSQSLRLEVADPDAVVAAALAAGATLERPVAESPYGRGGVVVDASGHRWMVSRETPALHPGDVVYASLWTPDADRAARFYGRLLGATHLGVNAHDGPPTTMLCHAVPDVDAAVDLVRAAGGTSDGAADQPYGRTALCADDQGLPFALSSMGAAPVGDGDLAYVDIRVPDAGRARAFYGTVLGWRFLPGNLEGYWHPTNADGGFTRPMSGLSGGHANSTVVPTFRVPDVAEAAAAVRAAGGTSTDPAPDHGTTGAVCTDDQGVPFLLTQP